MLQILFKLEDFQFTARSSYFLYDIKKFSIVLTRQNHIVNNKKIMCFFHLLEIPADLVSNIFYFKHLKSVFRTI